MISWVFGESLGLMKPWLLSGLLKLYEHAQEKNRILSIGTKRAIKRIIDNFDHLAPHFKPLPYVSKVSEILKFVIVMLPLFMIDNG